MYVIAIRTEGFRDRADLRNLGRRVDLPRGSAGAAVADALQIWAATLAPARLPAVLVSLGAASAEAEVETTLENGWLTGVGCDLGGEITTLLEEGEQRFAVEVTVQADPPFFGRLREHAVRDPRLVSALGESPTVTVRVGWFLSKDGCSTTVGLLSLTVGRTSFPVSGTERPVWGPAVLREMGERFARVSWGEPMDRIGARLLDIATGADSDRRARLAVASAALGKRPFRLGRLELVRVGASVVPSFGEGLVRARRLGPAAAHALALVEAVLIEQPDVLLVDGAGAGFPRPTTIKRWIEARSTGENATLEQVFFIDGGGA